jgi:tetratricopeptide (TPR) repeat protein
VLDAEAGRIDAAAARFVRASESDPLDGMASYLLGVARLTQGRLEEAVTLGYEAVKRFGTESLGYGLVGRAEMRLGRVEAAQAAFQSALASLATNRRLEDQLLAATYAVGDHQAARASASEILARGTTRLLPRAVLSLIGDTPLATFAAEARDLVGEDEFTLLELALFFADLGMYEEATRLLAASTVDGLAEREQRPLPRYYLAYFHDLLGNPGVAERYRARAAEMDVDYAFPSRPEAIPVLRAAIDKNARDGHARLLLGNLYAGLGRLDEAVEQWRMAVTVDPALSVAYRNLGIHAWRGRRDLDAGAQHLEQALEARPSDQTLYRDLAMIEVARGRLSVAIELLETMPLERPRRGDVTLLLARTYVDARQYESALRLLASTSFSNREGSTSTRSVFVQAHLERGRERLELGDLDLALDDFRASLTYPENLNVGRPALPQEAEGRYWEGRALQALGRLDEASAAWRRCAAGDPGGERQNQFIQRCREEVAAVAPPPGG